MKVSRDKYLATIKKLDQIKILVIGDIILDEYLMGEVTRISPEAPVPVVHVKSSRTTLGGAGNVVKNLTAFGVQTGIIGRVGIDEKGKEARSLLKSSNLTDDSIYLLENETIPTILKTRIIAAHQQICRVDHEIVQNLSLAEEDSIIKTISSVISSYNSIILSDYDKGLLTPSLIEKIIKIANANHKYISADPQVSHFFAYKGISIMTPNHHEAGNALGGKLTTEDDIEKANFEIANRLDSESMMITRGDKGLSIYNRRDNKHTHIPTIAREVFDVTGAGDTVISLFTSFRSADFNEIESAIIANAGGGLVVEKLGAETVSRIELFKSLTQAGIFE